MAAQIENELLIEQSKLTKGVLIIRAVRHQLRFAILKALHEKKQLTVTQIYTAFNLEQSVASQHLAILRAANAVKSTREGKSIYYSVNYKRLKEISDQANNLIAFSED